MSGIDAVIKRDELNKEALKFIISYFGLQAALDAKSQGTIDIKPYINQCVKEASSKQLRTRYSKGWEHLFGVKS